MDWDKYDRWKLDSPDESPYFECRECQRIMDFEKYSSFHKTGVEDICLTCFLEEEDS